MRSVEPVTTSDSTTTDQLLQLGNRRSQFCDGLLQSSYSILAGLEGGLLETRQGLKIHHPVLQETSLFRAMVDTIVRHLPLLREDDVVLLDGILDHIGGCQHLLSMLLSVSLNTMDLCRMGSPLHLSIVNLKGRVSEGLQSSFDHPPHPGFKLHYSG